MQDALKTVAALSMCFGIPYYVSNATDSSSAAPESSPSATSASFATPLTQGPGVRNTAQASPLYTPGNTSAEAQAYAPTTAPGAPLQATGERLEGPTFNDFAEVFRFDVTNAWMMTRWSRVSTAPREFNLQGYRVALLTGTRPDDIAGALTYYFSTDHQVAKITFVGATADPRRLTATMQALHGFDPVVGRDPGEFIWEVRRIPGLMGVMRIRPGEVVTADNPWSRYRVELSIERAIPRPW